MTDKTPRLWLLVNKEKLLSDQELSEQTTLLRSLYQEIVGVDSVVEKKEHQTPKPVRRCVASVVNKGSTTGKRKSQGTSAKEKSKAFAICHSMNNKGKLKAKPDDKTAKTREKQYDALLKKNESIVESRKKMAGKSLRDLGVQFKVLIYRAPEKSVLSFSDGDYVTRSKKFALGHAAHNADMEGETYDVIKAFVEPDLVFEAPNPGEFFYFGPSIKGKHVKTVKPSYMEWKSDGHFLKDIVDEVRAALDEEKK